MLNFSSKYSINYINKLALFSVILGGFLVGYYLLIEHYPYQNITTALFSERIAIPFDWVQIGPISFPVEVDNFLIFQEFKSLRPDFKIAEAYAFALGIGFASSLFLTYLSEFKKVYFVIGGVAWIILLTLSDFNGLNIRGVSSNYPLIIALLGTLVPLLTLHIWGQQWAFLVKWLLLASGIGTSIWLLISLSQVVNPLLYLSEHTLIIGFCLALAWIFWNGHAVLSGLYLIIARANQAYQLKVSVQILIVSAIYLVAVFFIFLELTGERGLPFPTFSPFYLLFPMGIFGWISIKAKVEQSEHLITDGKVIKTLHLIGFALALWLVWKLKISGNVPGEELLKHLISYSQIGFSLFFIVYLFSNFLGIMDSGKAIDRIVYKPFALPYYHLRIGGLITMLVLITYSDAIISVQVNAMTTNVLADYYYQTDQKLEASILYENAWIRYRRNPKAKNATAHLSMELKQPSLAKQHLEESFAEAPQVDNILLISDQLHAENAIFESVHYLEKGLNYFPNHPKLLNNLALFYTKINKRKEAIELLANATAQDEILLSNRSALETMAGNTTAKTFESNNLIARINLLAASNLLGNAPNSELTIEIAKDLQTSSSQLLINSGYRNLFASQKKNNPDSDLKMLDSLASSEAFEGYQMQLQETGIIRSLAAGRVVDAVKNLNGLAFRNPGDAGYYLQLSTLILAQNLDFRKAALELEVAQEKGFQAFQSYHWSIFGLGGMPEKALELREKFEVSLPAYLSEEGTITAAYLTLISRFHQTLSSSLFTTWTDFPESDYKTDLALRLITYKSHGLQATQIKELGEYISSKIGVQDKLMPYLKNPDLKSIISVNSLLEWLELGEELTGNPYYSPLILSAALVNADLLVKYEILNSATQFNRDPILWMKKIKTAEAIGLDNYASEALIQLQEWLSAEEILALQNRNN
jgi:hypothetical protein